MKTFDHRARRHAVTASRAAPRPLRVAPANDPAEVAADRLAEIALTPGPLGRPTANAASGQRVYRQTPAGAEGIAKKAQDANRRAGMDKLGEMARAVLADAATREPLKGLVAQGKALLDTPAGKIALAEAIGAAITGSVLAKVPLPIDSYTQDLGAITPALGGVSAKLTWAGPANSPTKVDVELGYAPTTGPLTGFNATIGGGLTAKGPVAFGPDGSPTRPPAGIFDPGAQVAGQGRLGAGYRLQGGPLKGSEIKASVTASPSGTFGGSVALTVPLGSGGPAKSKGSELTSEERIAQIRAEREAMENMFRPRTRDDEVQRRAEPAATSPCASHGDHAPESVRRTTERAGSALPADVRATFEDRLGCDFTGVRVHTDAVAAASARDIGAAAYTVGRHVVFGSGRWEPATAAGRRLLAHELVHVAQQSGSSPAPLGPVGDYSAHERGVQ